MNKHLFNYFVIFSLIRKGDSTQLLELKCKKGNRKTMVIPLVLDSQNKPLPLCETDVQKLESLSGMVCVYVHGHCGIGLDVFQNDDTQFVPSSQLADILIKNIRFKAITSAYIKLFACFTGSDLTPGDGSCYANRVFDQLSSRGVKNFSVIGYNGMVTIKENPATKKIIMYVDSAEIAAARVRFESGLEAMLGEVIKEFGWHSLSTVISPLLEHQILDYVHDHMTPQKIIGARQFAEFMSDLSRFVVANMHAQGLTSDDLMPCDAVLMVVKERIVAMTRKKLGIEMDLSMEQVKKLDHARPDAKLYFSFWKGKKDVQNYRQKVNNCLVPKFS
jgi:hypothetical protein